MAKITSSGKKYNEELTKRDKKILSYIEEKWYETGGYTPSYREICRDLNIKSTSTVYSVINKLEEKGYIKKIVNSKDKVKRYELLESALNEKGTNLKKRRTEKNEKELVSLRVAKVPLFGKILNKEEIYSEENFKEYVAFPVEYGKQKNIYAFESKNSKFKEKGIYRHSLVIYDNVEHYIHGDMVAYLNDTKDKIEIRVYRRTESKEEILGKIIGTYTEITY